MIMTREDELAPEQVSLRAAWEVIEEARGSKITGELAITTASSKTMIYLESGSVYFAEAEGDETLANRLVEAGAITTEQLRRGALRLNGVEHLGRLFERDATVERDAVELAIELMTEHALTAVAGQEVLSAQTTMYRQHSSGVVRWFTAPVVVTAPEIVAAVVDADDIVEEPIDEVVAVEQTSDEVVIDAAPMPIPTLPPATLLTPNRLAPRPPVNRLTQLVSAPLSLIPEPLDDEGIEVIDEVVEEVVAETEGVVVEPEAVDPPKASVDSVLQSLKPLSTLKSFMPITSRQPIVGPEVTPSPTVVTSEHDLAAMITDAVPLTVPHSTHSSDDDHDATPIPEDVAAAVRRAIDAIETAMHKPRSVTSVSFGPLHVTSLGHPLPTATPTPPPPPEPFMIVSLDAFGATSTGPVPVFAKPTGAMVHPILSFGELNSDGAVYPLPVLPPLPQRAQDAPSDQRRGALRRLIAGIRRR